MGKQSRLDRIRQIIAGWFFVAAAHLHESYDVWLDTAERKQPGQCTVPDVEHQTCNGYPREDCPGYNNYMGITD